MHEERGGHELVEAMHSPLLWMRGCSVYSGQNIHSCGDLAAEEGRWRGSRLSQQLHARAPTSSKIVTLGLSSLSASTLIMLMRGFRHA